MSFREAVIEVVKDIPAGSVLTYQEVAQQAGHKKAARAVANIMANNYDVSIPCHRVIRSDGTVGGYNRGGPEVKRAKLEKEGVILQE
jgi:O-6-methylguanine DNA methyltransferase